MIPTLFRSLKADKADATKVRPSAWNVVVDLVTALLGGADADGTVLTRNAASTTGALWVALTKASIGLGNVENTALSTGNAATATKLQTSRTINGVGFDGSANITLPASAGALVLLEQHTAATSASLAFTTGITATYDDYIIEILGCLSTTTSASLHLEVSTDGGGTWVSTNMLYALRYLSSVSTAGLLVASAGFINLGGYVSSAGAGASGQIHMFNPAAAQTKHFRVTLQCKHDDTNHYIFEGAGWYVDTTPINAFRIKFDVGNIASGTVRLYGVAKS